MTRKVLVDITPTELTLDSATKYLHNLVSKEFPIIEMQILSGKIVKFIYEDEWDEGSSIPVLGEKVKEEFGKATIDGREVLRFDKNYIKMKLTAEEKITIEKWVKDRT